MSKLISSDFLNENMDKYTILDCRFSLGDKEYGRNAYNTEHIENAVFIDFENELSSKIGEHGGRHPLPNVEKFISAMEKHGISDSTEVVIYDDGDLAGAGRLWWLFKYIGKENVYVLDGGLPVWKKKGYKTSNKEYKAEVSGKLSADTQTNILCDVNYVKAKLNDPDTVLVDSRAAERYQGLTEPIDRIPGHIPGAVNFPYGEAIVDGVVMNREELNSRFKSLTNKNIVVYCGSGVTGCVNFLLLEEIGLKPVLYSGSYSDWVSYPENEVEK